MTTRAAAAVRAESTFVSSCFLAILVVLQPGTATADLTPGDHLNNTLQFDGETRLYDVHVPPGYDGCSPFPLVLDLHGGRSNKTVQATISGFKAISDAEGFLVAYPLGLFGDPEDPEAATGDSIATDGPCWSFGSCCGPCSSAGVDDVGFLRALVAAIAAEANVDLRRVYATGLSQGGGMSHRLACDAADVFAAVAPLAFPAFPGPVGSVSSCEPSRPISVLQFSGTDDQLVPFDGCSPTTTPCPQDPDNVVIPSALDSFTGWRERDGCISVPDDPLEDGFVQGTSMCEIDTSCTDEVHVGLCSINGFDPVPALGHVLYFNDDDLILAQIAWDFLSQFGLPLGGPAATGTFSNTQDLSVGPPFPLINGLTTFDDATFNVLGLSDVNLGTAVGTMTFSGDSVQAAGSPPSGTFTVMNESTTLGLLSFDLTGDYICTGPTGCTGAIFDVSFVGSVTNLAGSVVGGGDGTLPTGSDIFYTVDGSETCIPSGTSNDCSGTFALNAFRSTTTPTGSDVTVTVQTSYFDPISGTEIPITVEVTYGTVTTAGETLVTAVSNAAGGLSSSFATQVGGWNSSFLDVSTTAIVSGPIRICQIYPDADDDGIVDGTGVNGVPSIAECAMRILHDEGGTFVDRTLEATDASCLPSIPLVDQCPDPDPPCIDTSANRICAEAASLSVFVVVVAGGDQLLPGRAILLRDKATNDRKRRVVATWKDKSIPFPIASPVDVGATLTIFNPDTTETDSYTAPPGALLDRKGWRVLQKRDGRTTGYLYRDRARANGPCTVILIKPGRWILAACRGNQIQYTLDRPGGEGKMAVKLSVGGTSYCTEFGPETVVRQFGTPDRRRGVGLFLAKKALAPASCPVP